MTEIETERLLFTIMIFILGFMIGLVTGHGKEDQDNDDRRNDRDK